ncbi:predicted protein [Histoplasma capsulatum H143]|uniref:Uncharacterized protein n=1 Tax=Ajellomyces capsulatus (strain H143) TaxID=544712 RepID=C6HDK2_AJECH|nr:predicted protein [Histoplasma capsulatum H143]
MDSNSQDSPDISTTEPYYNALPYSEVSRRHDGDHLPATPPTPDPWMWKCHKCLKKYKFEATTRCLDDGHYFCKTSNSNINKLRGDTMQKGSPVCESIFDSTGWEKFKAWQKKVRLAHGKEGEWESGCVNDCTSPPATPGQGWLATTALIDEAASSEDQSDGEEVRAGSKRARPKKAGIPPEAQPAKRRMLSFRTHG